MEESESKWLFDDGTDEESQQKLRGIVGSWQADYPNLNLPNQAQAAPSQQKNDFDNYAIVGSDNIDPIGMNIFLDGKCPISTDLNLPIEAFVPKSSVSALRKYGVFTLVDLAGAPQEKIIVALGGEKSALKEIERRVREIDPFNKNDVDVKDTARFPYRVIAPIRLPSGKFLDVNVATMSLAGDLGITPGAAQKLKAAGFEFLADLSGIDLDELTAIKGIGPAVIGRIRSATTKAGIPKEFWGEEEGTQGGILKSGVLGAEQLSSHANNLPKAKQIATKVILSDGTPLNARLCDLNIEKDLGMTLGRAERLRSVGIDKVSDLAGFTKEQLLSIDGLGIGALEKLSDSMLAAGIPSVFWESGTTNLAKSSFRKSFWQSLEEGREFDKSVLSIVGTKYQRQVPARMSLLGDSEEGFSISVNLYSCRTNIYSLLEGTFDSAMLDDVFAQRIFLNCSKDTLNVLSNTFSLNHFNADDFKLLLFTSLGQLSHQAGFDLSAQVVNEILRSLEKEGFPNSLAAQATELRKRCPDYIKQIGMTHFNVLGVDISTVKSEKFENILNLASENAAHLSLCEEVIDCLEYCETLLKQSDSYYQLFSQALLDAAPSISSREIDMTAQYQRLNGKKVALEDLGEQYGITRERVRQLITKHKTAVDFNSSLRLFALRVAVYAELWCSGGSMNINDLRLMLDRDFARLSGPLEAILAFDDGIDIFLDSNLVQLKSTPCASCCAAIDVCESLRGRNECLDVNSFACAAGCSECQKIGQPSLDVIAVANHLFTYDGLLGEQDSIPMRAKLRPRSNRAILHQVLFEADRALSYDEMIEAVKNKTGKTPNKNKISSQAGSFADCMLWDRGTYIHERNAPWPAELLQKVADHIFASFTERKIPIICVEGVYDARKSEFAKLGIPTRHALYSLLRRLNDERLELREYPWICDKQHIGERTSFAKYFYSILKQNNGFITDAHARTIAGKAMAQVFALDGLASYSPYLINANGGWYDIEAADFNMEGIAQLTEDLAERMGNNDIISTVKVFEDYRERCLKLGVKSHDILYYLIDLMEDSLPIRASRIPHLIKAEKRRMSVKEAATNYITCSNAPVTKLELIEEFKINRGINTSGISTALLVGGDIVLVGDDTYWSRRKLHINDEFISQFDEIIIERLKFAKKRANLFYSRLEVLPDYSYLPPLQRLNWNANLLKTVFDASGKFLLIGEDGNCIISAKENPSVINVETFYASLLKNEFMGWSPFDRFSEYCDAYSIKTNLAPEFFDAFTSIDADEISITIS